MCVQSCAADSAAARAMVGGSRIERKVVGPRPCRIICPAQKMNQKVLVLCDDKRTRWYFVNQLPEELRATALISA